LVVKGLSAVREAKALWGEEVMPNPAVGAKVAMGVKVAKVAMVMVVYPWPCIVSSLLLS